MLTANPINGAVSYRFEITNNTTNVVNYYNSPNNTFMLSQIPGGVIRNTNYNIRVSVFYNGQWYPYGSSCLLRTSWFSKQTEVSFNSIFKFSMFPNPAKDIVTIATETELKSVEIYSLQGQKVITSVSKTIEINNLPSGVYFVKVTAIEGLSNTKKLIIK